MNPLLEFSDLTKCYGSTRALDSVSFALPRGSVLALLGPNGAGKSTLFGCLLGLTSATKGATRFQGHELGDAQRTAFGYVAERVAVYPHRTVNENARFFAQLKGATDANEQLAKVGLAEFGNKKARELSKGMLQRLGLAIALCGRPEVLVLDEPFNGLDPVQLEVLQSLLNEEHRRGTTLLISTHTISAVEPLATHLAVLLEGRLAAFGTLEALHLAHGPDQSLEAIYHRIARTQLAIAA